MHMYLHTHTQDEATAWDYAGQLAAAGLHVVRMWYALDMFWSDEDQWVVSYMQ